MSFLCYSCYKMGQSIRISRCTRRSSMNCSYHMILKCWFWIFYVFLSYTCSKVGIFYLGCYQCSFQFEESRTNSSLKLSERFPRPRKLGWSLWKVFCIKVYIIWNIIKIIARKAYQGYHSLEVSNVKSNN